MRTTTATDATDRPAPRHDPAPTAAPGFWRHYGAMWKTAPKEFLPILVLGVISYAAFATMWALVSAGIGLLFVLLIGVFVFALPYIMRGLIWAHWGLARVMLGAFRSHALEQELAGAKASREALGELRALSRGFAPPIPARPRPCRGARAALIARRALVRLRGRTAISRPGGIPRPSGSRRDRARRARPG